MERAGLRSGGDLAGLSVASRTDRGVSARANALVVRSELPGSALLRAMNGISPEIFFTHAAPVSEEFRVRTCRSRCYRYFDAVPTRSSRARLAAIRLLQGRIDVRSLGRGVPSEAPCWREVLSLRSRPLDSGSVLEIIAPSFVWGMVRKMVAAIREVDAGRLPLAELRGAVRGGSRLTLPLAEPEPLVLWEVDHGVGWEYTWGGPNRRQSRYWSDRAAEVWIGGHIASALTGADRRSRDQCVRRGD